MDEANRLQKKSRRKYMIFALLLIVLVAAVIGVVFMVKNWSLPKKESNAKW